MNTDTLQIVHDRIELCGLPEDIQSMLLSNGLVTNSGKKVSFCGLIKTINNCFIFFPRQSYCDGKSVPDLFSAIRKYSEHSNRMLLSDDEGDHLVGQNELNLVAEILSDFHTNGIYTRRRRLTRTNKGKTNWSRTIKKFDPFLGSNGPVYLDYIGATVSIQADSEPSKIHAYIVSALDKMYGEILFGFESYQDDGLLDPKSFKKDFLIAVLRAELQILYSDRDIRLFKHLIKFLETMYGEAESNLVIGIKGFHTLWEHMLKSIIADTVDINREFSIPTYIDTEGRHLPAPQKGQRTDIIAHNIENDIYAVIDAKYYDALDLKSAPGWGDLLKQFFYAKAIKSLSSTSKVKNYFIFPGSVSVLDSVYMQKHQSGVRDSSYDDIQCLYLDPHLVIKTYIEGKLLEDLSNQLVA